MSNPPVPNPMAMAAAAAPLAVSTVAKPSSSEGKPPPASGENIPTAKLTSLQQQAPQKHIQAVSAGGTTAPISSAKSATPQQQALQQQIQAQLQSQLQSQLQAAAAKGKQANITQEMIQVIREATLSHD